MNVFTIKDIDGNVMYERSAHSKKEMIERLIQERKSLARADLRGANMEHLDLSFGDFSYANLDGALMVGCRAKKAVFNFASLRGTACDGMSAPYASFIRASILPHPETGKHTSFVGGNLPYTVWDKARCLKVDWSKADICSSTFVGTYLRRCNMFRVQARNVDWVDSVQHDNKFDKAVIAPRMKNTPEQFFPDRTKGAVIVGNSYKETVFIDKKKTGEHAEFEPDPVSTDRGFIWDKRITTIKNHLSGAAIAGGLMGLGMAIPFDLEHVLQGSLGTGAGFFAVASVAVLAKDKLQDLLKDQASDRLTDLDSKIRSVIMNAVKRGKSLGSLATAFMSSQHADALRKVIHDPDRSILARFKAVMSGDVDVLVCDRKHLAEGLSRLSEALHGRLQTGQDLVMTRTGSSADGYDAPNIIMLKRDGRMKAVWSGADGAIHRQMEWSSAGLPTQANEDIRFMGPFNGHRRVLKAFADAFVAEAGVAEFNWNPETHVIRRGRNDSVVVLNKQHNRMDNPDGPAIVSRNDEMIYFRNARQVDEFGEHIDRTADNGNDEDEPLQRRM